MMHLNINSGQVILADEEYFYILNRRGFYVCSMTMEPLYVYCYTAPINDNKITWWAAGWTETHIIVADALKYVYMIPRFTLDFEKINYNLLECNRWSPLVDKVPFVKSIEYSKNGANVDKEKLHKMYFANCLRFRQLAGHGSRYKRKDDWKNNQAQVMESVGKGIQDRDKILINGTIYCPLPGELANDICFSQDGLMLYVLHQMGQVSIIDVD